MRIPYTSDVFIKYKYIQHITTALALLKSFSDSSIVALDTETTGLYPQEGATLRLIQLYDGQTCLILDMKTIGYEHLETIKALIKHKQLKLVAHNAQFDITFLSGLSFDCTQIAAHTLGMEKPYGLSLKALVKFHLGVDMSKELQKSDWSVESLTKEQLNYAAEDVIYTLRLWLKLSKDIFNDIYYTDAYRMVIDCIEPINEMKLKGMPFDVEAHRVLMEPKKLRHEDLSKWLEETTGVKNIHSAEQMGRWVETFIEGLGNWPRTKKGTLQMNEDVLIHHAALFLTDEQKEFLKNYQEFCYLSAYLTKSGHNFVDKYVRNDRIYFKNINLTGTRTGRMSSSSPNSQNIPRDPNYRRLFIAGEGRKLIKADFSQIELRIAAEIWDEEVMRRAFKEGVDVHKLTASQILNKEIKDVTKGDRSIAKAVNFGLLYGQRPFGLMNFAKTNYGVDITLEEAESFREAFFTLYRGFAFVHDNVRRPWLSRGESEEDFYMASKAVTRLGRPRHFVSKVAQLDEYGDWLRDENNRVCWEQHSSLTFQGTEYLNTQVQGAGADLLLIALHNAYTQLKGKAIFHNAVHDEIIISCPEQDAQELSKVLVTEMNKAWDYLFPAASVKGTDKHPIENMVGVVECTIADDWAG